MSQFQPCRSPVSFTNQACILLNYLNFSVFGVGQIKIKFFSMVSQGLFEKYIIYCNFILWLREMSFSDCRWPLLVFLFLHLIVSVTVYAGSCHPDWKILQEEFIKIIWLFKKSYFSLWIYIYLSRVLGPVAPRYMNISKTEGRTPQNWAWYET